MPKMALCVLSLLVVLASSVYGQQCDQTKVFSLPITNVTLPNGAIFRGVPLSVGVPPQRLSFQPFWPFNATWVFDGHVCAVNDSGWYSNTACATTYGGMYTPRDSQTVSSPRVPAINDNSSVGDPVNWFGDNFDLGSDVILRDFEFGSPGPSKDNAKPLNSFSLSPDSTFLAALKDQGHISSKVWSYWWGADTATKETSQDGSIVIGGYDRAKTGGPSYTGKLDISPTCPTGMVVNVHDLLLTFPNGSTNHFLSPGESDFKACIRPDWKQAINLNGQIYDRFEALTQTKSGSQSAELYFYSMNYNSSNVYHGDLSISLQQGGLTFRIPNNQLVMPERHVDSATGQMVVQNSDISSVMMVKLTGGNAGDLSELGRPFMASAYTMVNLEAGTFIVWNAKPTQERDLVAVCAPTNTDTSPVSTHSPSDGNPGLSGGAIAGIVVGVIAVLAIIGAVAGFFFFIKRRKAGGTRERASDTTYPVDNKEVIIPAEPQEIEGRQLFNKQGLNSMTSASLKTEPLPRYEMPSSSQPQELGTERER